MTTELSPAGTQSPGSTGLPLAGPGPSPAAPMVVANELASRASTTPTGARHGSNRSPKRRRMATVAIVIAVLAVGGAVGTAFGANAYAENEVCDSLPLLASGVLASQDPTAAPPNAADTRKDIADLRSAARMLIFNGDLKPAVLGLATDLERGASAAGSMQTATPEQRLAMAPAMTALMGSIDGHLRDGQRACGRPETGIGSK